MTTISPPPHRIYLLRHAKAGWARPGERDFDRPLTDEGYAEAEIVADRAADLRLRPDLVISSTAARCRQTAEAVRRAFDEELEFRFVDDLYNCPADTYLEMLEAMSGYASVMMVGHNPAIEEVMAILIGHEGLVRRIPEGYPPGGLAVIDHVAEASTAQRWRLFDFLTA